MHNFIKSAFLLSLALIICACSKSDSYKKENVLYETDAFSINAEKINFTLPEDSVLNSDIQNDTDTWITDFESRVENNKIKTDELPNMQIQHKVYKTNDQIISAVTEKYLYISGAHGQIWWKPINFDIKNNSYLTLSDLFYDDEYQKVLNNEMQNLIEENPESYHDLWETPKIKNGKDDNFYLTENKLVIFFEPYDLSFYAKGVVEFPIDAKVLRGYIKDEYLNMLDT